MKYNYLLLLLALLAGGCEKAHDYIVIHPDAEMTLCTIKSISYNGVFGETDSLVFAYNALGDPVSISRRHPSSGFPNYVFKYDKRGRLTDFYLAYADITAVEKWNKYFYDNKGRIVIDSVYTLCRVSNGTIVDFYGAYRIMYDYDSQNRIVRESGGANPTIDYTYDANGNRIGGSYDNKVHFRRTNKIWMFLDRDYSMNNPFVADSYNSYGLPSNFGASKGVQTFLENRLNSGRILYSCR